MGIGLCQFWLDIKSLESILPRYFLSRTPSEKKYSPGVSVVPAKSEPIITVEAPRASALMIWPTDLIPPSATTGTPNLRAYSATRNTAVAWGRPTAITSCVMQMEPLPIPTRSASAPASIRFLAWEAVTTFPAMIYIKKEYNLWRSSRCSGPGGNVGCSFGWSAPLRNA